MTKDTSGWLSPSELGGVFGVSGHRIGRLLKKTGLHGEDDALRRHSVCVRVDSPLVQFKVTGYRYDPEAVIPVLRERLGVPKPLF